MMLPLDTGWAKQGDVLAVGEKAHRGQFLNLLAVDGGLKTEVEVSTYWSSDDRIAEFALRLNAPIRRDFTVRARIGWTQHPADSGGVASNRKKFGAGAGTRTPDHRLKVRPDLRMTPPRGSCCIRLSASRLLAAPGTAPAWLYKLAIHPKGACLSPLELTHWRAA